MKILFIEDCDEVRQLHVMLLDNLFSNIQITEALSGHQALEILTLENFDIILSDYEMTDGNGDVVYNYIQHNHPNIIFILFTAKNLDRITSFQSYPYREGKDFFISKMHGLDHFKEQMLDIINSQNTQKSETEYCKVRIYNFWKFNKALCDIYLQLSPDKYVKIINAGDQYTRQDIEKYAHKKQRFLYISSKNFYDFSVTLGQTPFLAFVAQNDPEEAIRTTHAMVHELVKSVGISDTAIELAEKTVTNVIEKTKSHDDLYTMLIQVRNRKDYIYDHSYLLSCICSHLAWHMRWSSSETLRKIIIASLFHDLSLDNPDLAMIHDLDDPKLKNFTPKEIKDFREHPVKMTEIIQKKAHLPPDVDTIVFQHHEKADGTGFPRKMSAQRINQITCIFIIAHTFVDELYACDFDETQIFDILERMALKFDKGNFKEPIKAFLQSFNIKASRLIKG